MPIWPAPARPTRTGRPSSASRSRNRLERLIRTSPFRSIRIRSLDHQPAARPDLGERTLFDAQVSGQRRLPGAVGLQVDVPEVDHVLVEHGPDRGYPQHGVVDADHVARLDATGGHLRPVQNGEEVQLLRRGLDEPDEQTGGGELLDLRADLGDRGRVPGPRGHQTSLMFSGLTPETKMSSLMNAASGPAGEVAWMSTVGTFFMGQTPTLAVPPQSMTATAILSNGAD